ncbi:MAG: hypothetical protein JXQ80_09920 [Bacteroidales bacterium]|nr:hypothetical protein [Bacteroidales bacterium]
MRQKIISVFIILSVLIFFTARTSNAQWEFSTNYFKISVNNRGFVTSMKNIKVKPYREFSPQDKPSPLMSLYNYEAGKYFYPEKAAYSKSEKLLTLNYGNGSVASIKLEPMQDYFKLTLLSLSNREEITDIQWGPVHTNITNLFGEIIGVARDTSERINYAIGLLALNNITTGGPANAEADAAPSGYMIHSPDKRRFSIPDSLKEGDVFTLGGDGRNDVAFYSRPEEYFRYVTGNTATIDTTGRISIAYHAQDRRKERMVFFPELITKNKDPQAHQFLKTNAPTHQVTQALPDVDYIGSSVALWGAPDSLGLKVIEKIVITEGLPHPKVNGKWIKDPAAYIPDVAWYGVYDSCISYVSQLGFKAIQAEGLGEFYPNRANGGHINWEVPFSDKKISIKAFTSICNEEGIFFGLHTLNNFLQSSVSSDVSPVPNDSLCVMLRRILTKDISATDTIIYIDDPHYLHEFGAWEGHVTNIMKIGKELIYYTGITSSAPYRLTGVIRGYWKTTALAHAKGSFADKLFTNCYGGLAPDIYLQDKLADYYAQLADVNGMFYIDLDGEEGFLYQGHGNYAYKRFFKRFFEQCKRKGIPYIRVMGAGYTEGAWHYQSVHNVGGGTNMYFIKDRKWAIEGKDIRNLNYSNYFPATFGITEPLKPNSTVQEWENLEALSVGVGVTYMLNLSQQSVESCPKKYEIFKAIRIWENARAAYAFSRDLKKILSDEKRQFHLEQIDNNNWQLFEVKSSGNIFISNLKRNQRH